MDGGAARGSVVDRDRRGRLRDRRPDLGYGHRRDVGARARLHDRLLRDRPPRPVGRDGDGVDVVGILRPRRGTPGGLHGAPAHRLLRLCRRRDHEQRPDGPDRARRRLRRDRRHRWLAHAHPVASCPRSRRHRGAPGSVVRNISRRPRIGVRRRHRRRSLRKLGVPARRARAPREPLGFRVRAAVDDLSRGCGDVVATPPRRRAAADRRVDPHDLAADRPERHSPRPTRSTVQERVGSGSAAARPWSSGRTTYGASSFALCLRCAAPCSRSRGWRWSSPRSRSRRPHG